MTTGDEDGEDSAASDSEPSEDNLEEAEMAKIIPIKAAKVPEKDKKLKKPTIKPTVPVKKYEEKSPTAGQKRLNLPARPARSPMKRIL